MARAKTFTQDQLKAAQTALQELPDLSADKIPTTEMLSKLKEQIIALATQKGYSAGDIQKALKAVGIDVSAKAISDTIGEKSKRAPKTRT